MLYVVVRELEASQAARMLASREVTCSVFDCKLLHLQPSIVCDVAPAVHDSVTNNNRYNCSQ